MSGQTLHCRLLTPQKICFEGDVSIAQLPGAEGDFGVLPLHMWLLSELRTGVLILEEANKKRGYFIEGGCTEVTGNSCVILADGARDLTSINFDDVKKERDQLAQKDPSAPRLFALNELLQVESMQKSLR